MVEKEGGSFFGSWELGQGNKMGQLRKGITDDVNARVAVGGWKVTDEIHGDLRPGLLGGIEGIEEAVRGVTWYFCPVTGGASLNVKRGVLRQRGPPILSLQQFDGTACAWVAGRCGVVMMPEDGFAYRFGDEDLVVVALEPIDGRPAGVIGHLRLLVLGSE